MKTFVFLILAVTAPDGELTMEVTQMAQCPDKVALQQFLEERVKEGEIKYYHAHCTMPVTSAVSGPF